MDLLDFGKFTDDHGQSVVKVLLGEFDLTHIEVPYSSYLIPPMDNSRSFSLCFRQDYICEILGRRHGCDSLEIVLVRHDLDLSLIVTV